MGLLKTPSGGWLPGGVHSTILNYDSIQYSTTLSTMQIVCLVCFRHGGVLHYN